MAFQITPPPLKMIRKKLGKTGRGSRKKYIYSKHNLQSEIRPEPDEEIKLGF